MKKVSLLFAAFVVFGIVATGQPSNVTKGVSQGEALSGADGLEQKVHPDIELDLAPKVNVIPAKIEVKPAQVEVLLPKIEVTPGAVQKIAVADSNSAVAVNGQSTIDRVKDLGSMALTRLETVASGAKYYLLGDCLTSWLVRKGYLADANKVLFGTSVFSVTPARLMNCAAVVALLNIAYFGYKAVVADNQDEDCFYIEDEIFEERYD